MDKWRTIRYTDEGCCLYQCLACKQQWEGRSAPGWFSTTIECDPGTPDAQSYQQGDETHYYVSTEPRYMPEWRYCPYCGVEWEGPLRCDVDNERMLGERRLKAERAMTSEHHYPKPAYYYVIQTRAPGKHMWFNKEMINPQLHTLRAAKRYLDQKRADEAENCEGFDLLKPDEFRIQIMKPEEITGPMFSIREVYYL